jgi:hypothetical protein
MMVAAAARKAVMRAGAVYTCAGAAVGAEGGGLHAWPLGQLRHPVGAAYAVQASRHWGRMARHAGEPACHTGGCWAHLQRLAPCPAAAAAAQRGADVVERQAAAAVVEGRQQLPLVQVEACRRRGQGCCGQHATPAARVAAGGSGWGWGCPGGTSSERSPACTPAQPALCTHTTPHQPGAQYRGTGQPRRPPTHAGLDPPKEALGLPPLEPGQRAAPAAMLPSGAWRLGSNSTTSPARPAGGAAEGRGLVWGSAGAGWAACAGERQGRLHWRCSRRPGQAGGRRGTTAGR